MSKELKSKCCSAGKTLCDGIYCDSQECEHYVCASCGKPFEEVAEQECKHTRYEKGCNKCGVNEEWSTEQGIKERWQQKFKKLINEQAVVAFNMVSIMQPKSEVEFIATVIPNLHIELFNFISQAIHQDRLSRDKELLEKIDKLKEKYQNSNSPDSYQLKIWGVTTCEDIKNIICDGKNIAPK